MDPKISLGPTINLYVNIPIVQVNFKEWNKNANWSND